MVRKLSFKYAVLVISMALEHRIQSIYLVSPNINFELGVGTLNRIFAGCESDAFLATSAVFKKTCIASGATIQAP